MNTSSLVRSAIWRAIAVAAYVALVAGFMNNAEHLVGQGPGFLGGVFMILLFVVSACITGALVLLKPMLLYADGQKTVAIQLLAYTVAALVVVMGIVLLVLILVQ